MRLEELKTLDKDFLTVEEVANVLTVDPQRIRIQARQDKTVLGFPVIMMGCRTLIPRIAFIRFCEGELTKADK